MKIKPGFVLRDVCGEKIIVSEGLQNIDFSQLISLNETAACMWTAIVDKDFTLDDMVAAITSEYEVDEETVRQDASEFLSQLRQLNVVVDS